MIKAVIFDIGGVLAISRESKNSVRGHFNLGVHGYIAKKLNIGLDQYLDSIDTSYILSIEGKISKEEFLSNLSPNFNISTKKLKKIFIKAYKKNFKQNKELYKIAFKLKKKGYKIAILSNQWKLSKEAVVLKKYTKRFNTIVISCDVGMRKPNQEIYALLLKKLNLKPEQCVFIDNQKWNLTPAKKLKMKTILFENNLQTIKDLSKLGVYI